MVQAIAESIAQRLQRFLREFDLDYYALAKLVIGMMEIPEPWVLSLDRTEWKFCEYKIAYITADREFLGHDWLDYLLSQPLRCPFEFGFGKMIV